MEEANLIFLSLKHALHAGPEASSVIAGSWYMRAIVFFLSPEQASRRGVARLPESRAPSSCMWCVCLEPAFSDSFLGRLKLRNAWVKLAVTYSKRIELRKDKGEDNGKRERQKKMFLIFPLERQWGMFPNGFPLTRQDFFEDVASRQWRQSQAVGEPGSYEGKRAERAFSFFSRPTPPKFSLQAIHNLCSCHYLSTLSKLNHE